jgi:hypothetical protein
MAGSKEAIAGAISLRQRHGYLGAAIAVDLASPAWTTPAARMSAIMIHRCGPRPPSGSQNGL